MNEKTIDQIEKDVLSYEVADEAGGRTDPVDPQKVVLPPGVPPGRTDPPPLYRAARTAQHDASHAAR
jgi:hypothetical protein